MAQTIVASAVTVPEADPDEPSAVNRLKRRQSEVSDEGQNTKRQRVSPGEESPDATASNANGDDTVQEGETHAQPSVHNESRRRSSVLEEKQRSKRLFGALLGSLSQPKDRTAKRRQEIESRRKAELQRQDDERADDWQRRQARLTTLKKKVQVDVDEENTRLRHEHLLHSANFLQTRSEPKLYYRPWELRPDEEDRIEDQLKDARNQIERELKGFDTQRRPSDMPTESSNDHRQTYRTEDEREDLPTGRPDESSRHGTDEDATAHEEDQAPAKSANNINVQPDAVPDSITDANADANKPVYGSQQTEEEGDHIVDGDEDTVIY